jgi:hypothetical protein
MFVICSDVQTRATVTCPLWFLSVLHLACRSQVTTGVSFSRCLPLWIRKWAPLRSRWINNQLSHSNPRLKKCLITNMVGFSRFISIAALKCAHLDKANNVNPAVVAEKVSTSILYLLGRICGDVVLFQMTTFLPIRPQKRGTLLRPLWRRSPGWWWPLGRCWWVG